MYIHICMCIYAHIRMCIHMDHDIGNAEASAVDKPSSSLKTPVWALIVANWVVAKELTIAYHKMETQELTYGRFHKM